MTGPIFAEFKSRLITTLVIGFVAAALSLSMSPMVSRAFAADTKTTSVEAPASVETPASVVGPASAETGSLTLRFDFTEPVVRTLEDNPRINGQNDSIVATGGRNLIDIPGTMLTMVPGRAAIPFRTARILLPMGAVFKGIQVSAPESRILAGRFDPIVTPAMAPLSFGSQIARRNQVRRLLGVFPENNDPGAAEPFPGVLYDNFSVQRLDGFTMVFVNLYPIDYNPGARAIDFRPAIDVTVKYEILAGNAPGAGGQDKAGGFEGNDGSKNGRPGAASATGCATRSRARVEAMADNPDALSTYHGGLSPIPDGRSKPGRICPEGYLIISSARLLEYRGDNSFHTLAERLTADGFMVSMAAVEEILESTKGQDPAAKVRDYIRQAHERNGVRQVLLGGDGDSRREIVPVRKLRAVFSWEGQTFDQDLPADVYYSCLDGTFDGNGNGRYGEPDDGEAGGDIDMLAEVFVGRATVATEAELQNFVRKTLAARDMAGAGKRGVILFSGESLFPGIYGKTYMGEIQYGASAHGFKTAGIPDGYPFDHLFDLDAQWGRREISEKLNSGPYWINHVGHSSQYSNMRLSTSSPAGLTNATPYLLYTQGCYCGQFTYDDCVIEKHLTAKNGAFATLSNSSYGLGPEDPDPDASVQCRGASQYLHRQFVDAVFSEGKARLGEANHDSKEDNIPFMNHGTARWVFFEMNLFGEPTIELVK